MKYDIAEIFGGGTAGKEYGANKFLE